ncbi:hypothetical protein ACIGEZ_12040 [Streptomyces sp. NPDC085481]|uniref:hypothetical protein n=1 Tax=Streptomyces sp. NPDC085481 TaxID=3365727 RepID=UPI0037D62235
MIRGFRRIGTLGVCAVAAAAFGAVAPAYAVDSSDGLEFTVYAKEVPARGADQSGQAPGVGDSFTFASDLFRTKGGDAVGRDGIVCTVVRTGSPGDMLCVGTIVLNGGPGGQLTGQNLLAVSASDEAPAAFDIAVTGGTGDFKDVRGWIRSTPDGDYERLDFHLSR